MRDVWPRHVIAGLVRTIQRSANAQRSKQLRAGSGDKQRDDSNSLGRTMSEPLLAVRGVKSFYGNIMALKGVALDVHAGEIVTLIGANGAGKSTLMMTIFGNPRAREGSIHYRGRDITDLRGY